MFANSIGCSRDSAGIADCVRCEVEQYLTRKRVVLRMQWLQSPREVVDFRGRDPRQRHAGGFEPIPFGRTTPIRSHTLTVPSIDAVIALFAATWRTHVTARKHRSADMACRWRDHSATRESVRHVAASRRASCVFALRLRAYAPASHSARTLGKVVTAGLLQQDYLDEDEAIEVVGERQALLGNHDRVVAIVEVTRGRDAPNVRSAVGVRKGRGRRVHINRALAVGPYVGLREHGVTVNDDTPFVCTWFRVVETRVAP